MDWNGNGKKDPFDSYMDMKLMESGGSSGGFSGPGCGTIVFVVILIFALLSDLAR
ncbi:MAG: hypothetical protein Q4B22_07105 [Eubacteriales bacterium]|nr:hypothetical protein [Eubacteriales bacterium]